MSLVSRKIQPELIWSTGVENFIPDVKDEEFQDIVKKGLLRATTDYSCVPKLDVIVIAVPTPLTKNLTLLSLNTWRKSRWKYPNIFVRDSLSALNPQPNPGTTEQIMLPVLAASGLKVNKDFFLVHSPERVDPGNQRYTTKNTTKVVGGVGAHSNEVGMAFYSQTIENVVSVSSAKAAELTKVFENTFRAVNIALVNELTLLCDKMNLNIWEVLDARFH